MRSLVIALALTLAAARALSQTQTPPTQFPPAQAPQAPQPPSTEATLLQADRDFNRATKENGLEGWMQFMADDVILLRGKPVIGKDAVRSTLSWTYHGKNEKGEKVTLQGDYLTVWQKQADGSWKVIYDGGTPDPATK